MLDDDEELELLELLLDELVVEVVEEELDVVVVDSDTVEVKLFLPAALIIEG